MPVWLLWHLHQFFCYANMDPTGKNLNKTNTVYNTRSHQVQRQCNNQVSKMNLIILAVRGMLVQIIAYKTWTPIIRVIVQQIELLRVIQPILSKSLSNLQQQLKVMWIIVLTVLRAYFQRLLQMNMSALIMIILHIIAQCNVLSSTSLYPTVIIIELSWLGPVDFLPLFSMYVVEASNFLN